MSSVALTGAMTLALPGFSMSAWAQVTDQTDQSEEDWRKSRKKSGTSDIYRSPNSSPTGAGAPIVEFEPISPVERLPSESRRHLMKERAKAIAQSDDGDISDADYVPSDAAQSDPELMRDEQEAWEVIVTDMQGSGGEATFEGGPNKVAVAGQNGTSPTRGSRGGSTLTLQEIMDAIKAGQTGSGPAAGSTRGQSSNGPPSDGTQDQGQDQGEGSGEDQSEPTAETASASDDQGEGEASADGQSDGDSQSKAEGQGDASAQGESSEGRSQGNAGDNGSDGDDGTTGASGEEGSPADTRAEDPLSPLERIRISREESPTRGTQRSASDYLGTGGDN